MNNKPLFKKLYYSPVLAVFLIGVFILTYSVNVYAADNVTYRLPYVIQGAGYNTLFNTTLYNACIHEAQSYGLSSSDTYIIYPTEVDLDNSQNWQYVKYEVIFNPYINTGFSYDSDFNYGSSTVPVSGSKIVEVRIQYSYGDVSSSSSNISNVTKYLLGSRTTHQTFFAGHNGTFTNYYPVYLSNDGLFTSDDKIVIAQELIINQPDTGHVTGPNTGHHITNPNGGTPSNPPSYTINNYTWSTYTPPVVDLTTVEGLLKGIIDTVQSVGSWLGSNLAGMLANLLSNIKGLFDFLGDLLRYLGREIQDSIHDVISLIYDNLVSFFTPYFETISNAMFGLQELFSLGYDNNGSFDLGTFFLKLLVPSASDVVDLMEEHDHFGVISFWSSLNTKYTTIWTSIFNTSSVKRIYVPSTTYHGQTIGGFYIDFSWYDDYKVYGDTVISAFLIFGYFYWLYLNVNYFLRGTAPNHIPNMTEEKGVHL